MNKSDNETAFPQQSEQLNIKRHISDDVSGEQDEPGSFTVHELDGLIADICDMITGVSAAEITITDDIKEDSTTNVKNNQEENRNKNEDEHNLSQTQSDKLNELKELYKQADIKLVQGLHNQAIKQCNHALKFSYEKLHKNCSIKLKNDNQNKPNENKNTDDNENNENKEKIESDDYDKEVKIYEQKLLVIRGQGYLAIGRPKNAKKDFDACVKLLQGTKENYQARLHRSKLKINHVDHLHEAEADLKLIIEQVELYTLYINVSCYVNSMVNVNDSIFAFAIFFVFGIFSFTLRSIFYLTLHWLFFYRLV